jgi:hypothetical protein
MYVIDNMTSSLEIDRKNGLVKAIFFIAIEIFSLCAVATVMQEEAVAGLGIGDQPVHGADHIGFSRPTNRIGLVVCKSDDIIWSKAMVLDKLLDVLDVVDAAFQRLLGANIVDSDQKGLE